MTEVVVICRFREKKQAFLPKYKMKQNVLIALSKAIWSYNYLF